MATHRIRFLTLRAAVPGQREAFSLRAQLRMQCETIVHEELNAAFDRIAPDDCIVRVPKLALTVSVRDANLLGEFPQLLQRELKNWLQTFFLDEENTITRMPNRDTKVFDDLTKLLHYLQTGLMPWNETHRGSAEVAVELGRIAAAQQPALLLYCRQHNADHHFHARLLQLLQPEPRRQWIATCVSALATFTEPDFVAALQAVLCALAAAQAHGLSTNAQQMLLTRFLAMPQPPSQIHECLHTLAEMVLSAAEKMLWRDWIAASEVGAALAAAMPAKTHDAPGCEENSEPKNNIYPFVCARASGRTAADQYSELNAEAAIECAPRTTADAKTAQALFPLSAPGAGLVLLHPYLPRLFAQLDIFTGGTRQIEPATIPRAAWLLHYLLHGEKTIYEFELGFIKVLLGQTPAAPLSILDEALSARDRDEADALLRAALQHWSALKNTSVDGLRSAFLQRNGLLREGDNGWRLHVERKAFDMLRDRLPWSISLVKLPWMQRALFVEW